ncbi:MAG: phosphatase PAP2 family protein [Acidaminococcus sp.]|jgi:undecaprenyl-diphosphatase|nr:phosphatase PAP2 family protein [Acidaminococcus sp.]MCI2100924.1 phosphatase PAP2 family protein [Acidaminococcus sp.]MCI2115277.1 phosphatase PAP2 family protein [Acidaminococcus sp.]MCI2117320.1 phosphatase PAP2 family protein [Acidaminococcus sp.]
MEALITSIDHAILLWIHETLRTDIGTHFWEEVTDLGNVGLMWILLSVSLCLFKKTRLVGLSALAAFVIDAFLTNGVLKHWMARPRPFITYEDIMPLIPPPTDFSFPSGHTTSSFAVAFVFFELLPKKLSIPALLVAAAIAFSRLYLGVHYPTDVLAGMFIGYIVSRIAIFLVRYLSSHSWRSDAAEDGKSE